MNAECHAECSLAKDGICQLAKRDDNGGDGARQGGWQVSACETCPEMDNPDSYIRHLHRALEWHDEHVPRPTNPHATVVVLSGERPPDEVLFVGPDGVTHYLPEGAGTCENTQDDFDFMCSECGKCVDNGRVLGFRFCPNCGREIKEDK